NHGQHLNKRGKTIFCVSINKTVLRLLFSWSVLGLNSAPEDDVQDQQQTHVSSSIVSGSLTMTPPRIESFEEFLPFNFDSGSCLNTISFFMYITGNSLKGLTDHSFADHCISGGISEGGQSLLPMMSQRKSNMFRCSQPSTCKD
ncbi:hypothetical protein J6590_107815, partial [Homalodisca vitripennis]